MDEETHTIQQQFIHMIKKKKKKIILKTIYQRAFGAMLNKNKIHSLNTHFALHIVKLSVITMKPGASLNAKQKPINVSADLTRYL